MGRLAGLGRGGLLDGGWEVWEWVWEREAWAVRGRVREGQDGKTEGLDDGTRQMVALVFFFETSRYCEFTQKASNFSARNSSS